MYMKIHLLEDRHNILGRAHKEQLTLVPPRGQGDLEAWGHGRRGDTHRLGALLNS